MKKQEEGHGMAIGLGIIAAAAGAYFLYGSTEGPARRKALKSWMVKMKGEIMEELENVEELSEEAYHMIVEKIREKYALAKNVDADELEEITKKIKGYWKDIQKETKKGVKKVAKK